MSSELQLDVRHLNRRRRRLVNAYEVKADMVLVVGKVRDPCGLYITQGGIQVLCFTFTLSYLSLYYIDNY